MKKHTHLIAIAGSSKADGVPRQLAGVAYIQDNRLYIETTPVLLHVKLRRCVIVLTLPDASTLQIHSHVNPIADPMPVRCTVQLKTIRVVPCLNKKIPRLVDYLGKIVLAAIGCAWRKGHK